MEVLLSFAGRSTSVSDELRTFCESTNCSLSSADSCFSWWHWICIRCCSWLYVLDCTADTSEHSRRCAALLMGAACPVPSLDMAEVPCLKSRRCIWFATERLIPGGLTGVRSWHWDSSLCIPHPCFWEDCQLLLSTEQIAWHRACCADYHHFMAALV